VKLFYETNPADKLTAWDIARVASEIVEFLASENQAQRITIIVEDLPTTTKSKSPVKPATESKAKRGPGRPRKSSTKRGPGRPRKS
jgi:hypothetical protein